MAQYPVACGCGRTHLVSGGAAGSRLACGCGQTVDVPGLRTLREAAGEPTASPELVIEALLRDGQIPGELVCTHCGAATEEVCHVRVECERPEAKAEGWKLYLMALAGMWFAALVLSRIFATEANEMRGRNVAYRLPVRMCRGCGRGLARSAVSAALRKIEVYRRLLDKYPHTSVSRPEC